MVQKQMTEIFNGRKKILFLTHYFPPESNAPASRVYEICKRWVRRGCSVTVVTCVPNVPNGIIYENYKNHITQREKLDGIDVIRIWTYIAANKGTFFRIINYLSFAFSSTIRTLFLQTPDIIIATSPQFFCGWAGVAAKLLKRTPLILEIRDLWPDSIVAVGAIENPKIVSSLEWTEKKMYQFGTHIVTVGDGYYSRLLEKEVPPEKMTVITNGVDREVFKPSDPDERLRKKYGLEGKFVCSYTGTIGMACALDITLRAAKIFKQMGHTQVVFLLIGDGAVRNELQRIARQQELDNIVFTGRQDKSLMPRFLSVSDCCLVHLRKTELFQSVLPSKMFDALAMKKPVLLGVQGSAAQVIEKSGGGICFEPENEDQLVESILRLMNDLDLGKRLGEQGYQYVIEHYDRDRLSDKYLELIQHICNES